MKTGTVILVAVMLLLAGAAAVSHLVNRSVQSRVGPPHAFALAEIPCFLTEELALAKARDALSRDGYDVAVWQSVRDARTTAPDGRNDEFMARNAVTTNHGVITFTNAIGSKRLVHVTLDGGQVVCRIVKPK